MAGMNAFDWIRFQELQDRSVPQDLAETASRHRVWKAWEKGYQSTKLAWIDGQEHERIADLDWIEFIPGESALAILESTDHTYPSLTDCAMCCGIPEDECPYHGIE